MNLPEIYIEKMEKLLGSDFKKYLEIFNEKRMYGLRINTLKIDKDEFKRKNVFDLKNVPWCENGFYYDETLRPAKTPFYHAGLYYLQEPSAMAAVSFLPIEENDKVLDICAAPGGKSTQIAALLKESGVLVSNDISAGRTKALLKNIEIFGIKSALVTSETPKKLLSKFNGYFDKIIIDAPCSGEGMFRKDPDIIKSWNEGMTSFCEKEQKEILDTSSRMLCDGGYILYSTCTFSPDENEGIINNFLKENKNFEIVPLNGEKYGFDKGHPNWVSSGDESLCGCLRLWPHKIKGEGHFLALLHNKNEKKYINEFKTETKTDERFKFFEEFIKGFIETEFKGVFQIINDNLYLLPENLPNLNGIRIVRSGWHLGEFKKNRFEPSQAFAMGLKKTEVKRFAEFSLEDDRVIRYLKGETIDYDNIENGWCGVFVDGFILGFAKAQNGRLKNKYYAGWKWE